jgi:hypothetical protein
MIAPIVEIIYRIYKGIKWLYYHDDEDSKRRNELTILERMPNCIMYIKQLKRKEIGCYKPFDLSSQEED